MSGCVSYRLVHVEWGRPLELAAVPEFRPGQTTLDAVLAALGAPDEIHGLKGRNLLLYRRGFSYENSFSLSLPFSEFAGSSAEVSASGKLIRYDLIGVFVTPDGLLENLVVEIGSDQPYLSTLWGPLNPPSALAPAPAP